MSEEEINSPQRPGPRWKQLGLEERLAGAISRSQKSNWPVGAAPEN